MIKAVIVEDESIIAKELQYKLSVIAPDIEVITVLPSLKTAFKYFMEHAEPDMMFMDIQLSDGVSFEILERYDLKCPVIFTTAYDEYAIKAFKMNGVDYLLKPVDEDDLKKAIDKAKKIIESKNPYPYDMKQLLGMLQTPGAANNAYKQKFIVEFRHQWLPINVNDIACFYRENLNYLVTFSGDKYILDYATLEEVEALLDPKVYYRANRQFIIHIDAVQSVKPKENSKLTITLKAPLKMEVDISREKAPDFKKWFDR